MASITELLGGEDPPKRKAPPKPNRGLDAFLNLLQGAWEGSVSDIGRLLGSGMIDPNTGRAGTNPLGYPQSLEPSMPSPTLQTGAMLASMFFTPGPKGSFRLSAETPDEMFKLLGSLSDDELKQVDDILSVYGKEIDIGEQLYKPAVNSRVTAVPGEATRRGFESRDWTGYMADDMNSIAGFAIEREQMLRRLGMYSKEALEAGPIGPKMTDDLDEIQRMAELAAYDNNTGVDGITALIMDHFARLGGARRGQWKAGGGQ